jgi:hypothetical protein
LKKGASGALFLSGTGAAVKMVACYLFPLFLKQFTEEKGTGNESYDLAHHFVRTGADHQQGWPEERFVSPGGEQARLCVTD